MVLYPSMLLSISRKMLRVLYRDYERHCRFWKKYGPYEYC